jgi:hypothetical protein
VDPAGSFSERRTPMEDLLRQFRKGAATRRGIRYSSELRQVAVRYAEQSEGAGWSRERVAETLGLCKATLCRWLRAAEPEVPALHEVLVVGSRPRSGPVLILPSGARVEGLSVDELAKLLGAIW